MTTQAVLPPSPCHAAASCQSAFAGVICFLRQHGGRPIWVFAYWMNSAAVAVGAHRLFI